MHKTGQMKSGHVKALGRTSELIQDHMHQLRTAIRGRDVGIEIPIKVDSQGRVEVSEAYAKARADLLNKVVDGLKGKRNKREAVKEKVQSVLFNALSNGDWSGTYDGTEYSKPIIDMLVQEKNEIINKCCETLGIQ